MDVDAIIGMMGEMGRYKILNKMPHILQTIVNNVKVDFVDYSRYQWIDDAVVSDNLRLASIHDIAAMKVNAIIGIGTKKDFVDMFVLLQHYTMADILSFYKQKYPEYSEYRALLSMTYFDDAEKQDMPLLFIDNTWDEMKTAIVKAVTDYQR